MATSTPPLVAGCLLCSIAGKSIPTEGDAIHFAGYIFRIAVVSSQLLFIYVVNITVLCV